MRITIKATSAGVGADVTEKPNENSWRIGGYARLDDPSSVKLATGGDLSTLKGRYTVSRLADSRMKPGWVGYIDYHKSRAADAEIPGADETFWVVLYAADHVCEQLVRFCAEGHLPTLALEFPDDEPGDVLSGKKREPNGLTYADEYIYDDIAWDNVRFDKVAFKSADIHFEFPTGSSPNAGPEDDLSDPKVREKLTAMLPATRSQVADLITLIRNVGIGLGILAVVLHFLH